MGDRGRVRRHHPRAHRLHGPDRPGRRRRHRRPERHRHHREPEPADVYYKNCDAVRAAGADPIHVGEPGYAKHLDRDGVNCR
ncbi:excalibur calcium-binding domain-containing protein [Tessaracoccus terricola]